MVKIEDRIKCKAIKLSPSFEFDLFLTYGHNNSIIAVAEMKCRTHASTDYPTVFLSKRKIEKMLFWPRHHLGYGYKDIRSLLFVRFTDCDMVGNVYSPKRYAQRPLCAANHNDERDTEIVCELPIADFNVFK